MARLCFCAVSSLTCSSLMIMLLLVTSSSPTITPAASTSPEPDAADKDDELPVGDVDADVVDGFVPSPYSLTMFFIEMADMDQPLHCAGGEAATILRWKMSTMTMIGIVTTTAAADSVDGGRVELVRPDEECRRHRDGASGDDRGRRSRTSKSFQAKNVRMAAVKTPGARAGRSPSKACQAVAPSSRAACSSSSGCRGNAVSVRIASGRREGHARDDQARPGVVERQRAPACRGRDPTKDATGNMTMASAIDGARRACLELQRRWRTPRRWRTRQAAPWR